MILRERFDANFYGPKGLLIKIINPSLPANTGTLTLALYEIPEPVTTSIVADGPPVVVKIPTAGQHAHVTFNGTAGQRVSIRISEVNFTWGYVEVRNPNGSWIGDSDVFPEWEFDNSLGDPIMLIDTLTLQSTGTYTINVYPDFISNGSLKLEVFTVPPDVTATIIPGGPPVTVTTTVPGQNARVTFNGTSGQRLSLVATESIQPFSLLDVDHIIPQKV
jgi:large repetitive protein